jgi:hypothetical protein
MPIINDTFKYLGFFDKNGTDLNFEFNNATGILNVSVNLPEI